MDPSTLTIDHVFLFHFCIVGDARVCEKIKRNFTQETEEKVHGRAAQIVFIFAIVWQPDLMLITFHVRECTRFSFPRSSTDYFFPSSFDFFHRRNEKQATYTEIIMWSSLFFNKISLVPVSFGSGKNYCDIKCAAYENKKAEIENRRQRHRAGGSNYGGQVVSTRIAEDKAPSAISRNTKKSTKRNLLGKTRAIWTLRYALHAFFFLPLWHSFFARLDGESSVIMCLCVYMLRWCIWELN